MAKPNKKGRSDYQSFVRIDRYLINSEAYRSLSVYGRALLVEIKHRYNGRNNGEIVMSVREAASRLGASIPTAQKALRDLEARGFIRATVKGAFTLKHRQASLWALTDVPVSDALPSKEFMRWRPTLKFKTQCNDVVPTVQSPCTVTLFEAPQKALTVQRDCTVTKISRSHGTTTFHTFIIPGGGVSKPSPKTIELAPKTVGAKIRQNFFMHHIRRHLEGALL